MVWNETQTTPSRIEINARTQYHNIDNKSSLHPKLETYYHLHNVMRNDVIPVSGGVKVLVCNQTRVIGNLYVMSSYLFNDFHRVK